MGKFSPVLKKKAEIQEGMAIIKKGNFAFNERKLQGMKNLIGHGFMGHDEAQIVIIIYSAAVVALFLQLQTKLGPFFLEEEEFASSFTSICSFTSAVPSPLSRKPKIWLFWALLPGP